MTFYTKKFLQKFYGIDLIAILGRLENFALFVASTESTSALFVAFRTVGSNVKILMKKLAASAGISNTALTVEICSKSRHFQKFRNLKNEWPTRLANTGSRGIQEIYGRAAYGMSS